MRKVLKIFYEFWLEAATWIMQIWKCSQCHWLFYEFFYYRTGVFVIRVWASASHNKPSEWFLYTFQTFKLNCWTLFEKRFNRKLQSMRDSFYYTSGPGKHLFYLLHSIERRTLHIHALLIYFKCLNSLKQIFCSQVNVQIFSVLSKANIHVIMSFFTLRRTSSANGSPICVTQPFISMVFLRYESRRYKNPKKATWKRHSWPFKWYVNAP